MVFVFGRGVVFVAGLGWRGSLRWQGRVEDRREVFLAGEGVRGDFGGALEGVVFLAVVLGCGGCVVVVFVCRSSAVRAPVAHVRLAAEVVRPAFGELRARDVGGEDLVHGAVVEDYVAGWLVDACFEGAGGELERLGMSALLREDAVAFHDREVSQTRRC